MNITTRWVVAWTGETLEHEFHAYDGEVALCCGASAAQNNIQSGQESAYTTMTNQAQSVFGASSAVFQDLQKSFAPTVAAGPSQQGFSPAELSNLNSAAITNTGNAYRNAKAAVGNQEAAAGGGNSPDLTGGARVGTEMGLAESAANETSSQLNQIGEANYATGRQNYNTAASVLSGAPGVFNAASEAGNAATGSGKAASDTANQIATQDNSWMQAVGGALGGIAGGVATGGMSNLGKGLSFFGKSAGRAASNPGSGGSYDSSD